MILTNFSWQWYDHQKARQPPTCHMSSHWQQYVPHACQKAYQSNRKHVRFHSYANSIASPLSDGHLPMEFKRTRLALLRWPGSPDDRWSLLSAPVVKPLPNLAFRQSYHHVAAVRVPQGGSFFFWRFFILRPPFKRWHSDLKLLRPYYRLMYDTSTDGS